MKILHLYKDYHPVLGGIENHIRALAEAQARAGHEVEVLVAAPGRLAVVEAVDGVTVYRAPSLATVASTPLSPAIALRLARLSPDITHLHFPYPVGEVSQLLLNRGRAVVTYHSDVVRGSQRLILRLYRPLMRLVLRRAARVIATSPNYIVSSPHLRRLADRCVVVPLGVDVRRFTPRHGLHEHTKQHAAAPSPLPPPPSTLLFLGRLRYYKGLDALIEAMPQIEARLLIGGDGPMRAEWQALAERLGVGDRVEFAGEIPDESLADFYRVGDVFVLPASARSEAFGTVLLEAMACGLPCITTELGTGTTFLVQDGANGLVVPPRNPRALADAANRLLADAELRAQMGRAGLERVRRDFTVEKMVERVEAVYAWALAHPISARPRALPRS